jgi:hypothetical protein
MLDSSGAKCPAVGFLVGDILSPNAPETAPLREVISD